jgi:hypothetical protein
LKTLRDFGLDLRKGVANVVHEDLKKNREE